MESHSSVSETLELQSLSLGSVRIRWDDRARRLQNPVMSALLRRAQGAAGQVRAAPKWDRCFREGAAEVLALVGDRERL